MCAVAGPAPGHRIPFHLSLPTAPIPLQELTRNDIPVPGPLATPLQVHGRELLKEKAAMLGTFRIWPSVFLNSGVPDLSAARLWQRQVTSWYLSVERRADSAPESGQRGPATAPGRSGSLGLGVEVERALSKRRETQKLVDKSCETRTSCLVSLDCQLWESR